MKGRGAVGLAAATPPRGPSRDLPACFMWPSLISPGGEKHRKLLREKNPGECQQTDLIKCQTREKLSSTQRNPAKKNPSCKAYIYTTGSKAYIYKTSCEAYINKTSCKAYIYKTSCEAYIYKTSCEVHMYKTSCEAYTYKTSCKAYTKYSTSVFFMRMRVRQFYSVL